MPTAAEQFGMKAAKCTVPSDRTGVAHAGFFRSVDSGEIFALFIGQSVQ